MNKYKHLRDKAIELRNKNRSLGEICEMLKLPKTTVYYWIKNISIPRTDKQRLSFEKLRFYGGSGQIAKFAKIRQEYYDKAILEYDDLSKELGFNDFVSIYCCEGTRKDRNSVAVVNADLSIMKIVHFWFKKLAKNKLSYMLVVYDDHDVNSVLKYWKDNLNITNEIKVYLKSSAGKLKGRNNRLEFGVFTIRSSDTYFRSKLQAWMDILKAKWMIL